MTFVQVAEDFIEEQTQMYLEAILESEDDIENERLISQEDLQEEVKSW